MSDVANSGAAAGGAATGGAATEGGDEGGDEGALVESGSDAAPTRMAYDAEGRAPWFVYAVWAVALTAYVLYMVTFALPDLRAWLR